ncbi:MAG: type I-U CRISPR-associated protein Csb2 [Syntrophobacteraceae bacterium]|jgi:CRISPR-associated protein Csb2
MPSYLCITINFLDPFFHGKGDRKEPEWPPSPMRVFQALLAGSRTGCHNIEWSTVKSDAFRWLERRKAPVIIAPSARQAYGSTVFVPNNDSDEEFDRQNRLTTKHVRPHCLLSGTLHYLWQIDESEDGSSKSCAEVLCCEARHLIALGWGIDQVVGCGRIMSEAEATTLPGHRWRAWDGLLPGYRTYRLPIEGSLEDLEAVHQSFLRRVNGKQYCPPLKLRKFDTVAYLRESGLPPRPSAVFELPEEIAFRQEDTVRVAAMLRSLACKLAREDTHKFPGESDLYVAGHMKEEDQGRPRFSYLPLPTIGHAHADGMIRRLMIAEPLGGDGTHARWAKNRLRREALQPYDPKSIALLGKDRTFLCDLWRSESKGVIDRYVGKSRTWCSVTPVILPGYDDFKMIKRHDAEQPTKAERLLCKCLIHAGIPMESVAGVTLRRAPFWPGSQHPRYYHRPDYLKDHHARPGWHVRLVFREPFAGPLAIGAGRHCGLGILAGSED